MLKLYTLSVYGVIVSRSDPQCMLPPESGNVSAAESTDSEVDQHIAYVIYVLAAAHIAH